MKREFENSDVLRWQEVYGEDPAFSIAKIKSGQTERGLEIVELARAHQYVALISIALCNYSIALSNFAAVAYAWAYLLERYAAGDTLTEDVVARSSQGFIFASASGVKEAMLRLCLAFDAACDAGLTTVSLHDHGFAIRWLCCGDLARTRQALASTSAPNALARKFVQSIVDRDEVSFRSAVDTAIRDWRRRIGAERLHKFPDAVCDDRVFGWVRLATSVWGSRPEVDLSSARIPLELFDTKAQSITFPL